MPLSRQATKAEVEFPVAILSVHLLGYGENRTVDVLITRALTSTAGITKLISSCK